MNARRAKARPSRLVIPILVAVALLGVGGVAAVRLGSDSGSTVVGPTVIPSAMATQATVTPSPAPASPEPSNPEPSNPEPSSDEPTASGSDPGEDVAKRALTSCRAKVRAADLVLKSARTGVRNWAAHVKAQTDANWGKISTSKMEREFKRTRRAGPRDQKRYADAVSAYGRQDGSCAAVKGASQTFKTALARCSARAKAQRPVMAAADPALADWKSHLAAMQRSRQGHAKNAQASWLRAWRSAPKNLDAYAEAAADFDAPRC